MRPNRYFTDFGANDHHVGPVSVMSKFCIYYRDDGVKVYIATFPFLPPNGGCSGMDNFPNCCHEHIHQKQSGRLAMLRRMCRPARLAEFLATEPVLSRCSFAAGLDVDAD